MDETLTHVATWVDLIFLVVVVILGFEFKASCLLGRL
jgi:hypothetical protein